MRLAGAPFLGRPRQKKRRLSLSGTADLSDGALAGTITTGACLVAPEGHVYCSALFSGPQAGVNPLRFIGLLSLGPEDTVSGTGSFLIGYDPPFDMYVQGVWRAVRIGTEASH
jgi:hypothetical protein